MGIGFSLLLVAIGAVLVFATDVSVSGLDLDAVGWVLMLVGVVGLAITLLVFAPRRRAARVERRVVPGEQVVERRVLPTERVVERPVMPTERVVERPVMPTERVVERRTYQDPTL